MNLAEISNEHPQVEPLVNRLRDFLGGEELLHHDGASLFNEILANACIAWKNLWDAGEHMEDCFYAFLYAITDGITDAANYHVSIDGHNGDIICWDFTQETLSAFLANEKVQSARKRRQLNIRYTVITPDFNRRAIWWIISHHICNRHCFNAIGLPMPGWERRYSVKEAMQGGGMNV